MEVEVLRQAVPTARNPSKLDEKIQTIRSFLDFMEGGADPQFPLGTYIEVSNICNFKCAMCTIFSAVNEKRVSDTKSLNRGFLGFDEQFRKIGIESLPHMLNVRAFGFGEPTIHPNFREILEFLSEQEVAVSFFTNGSKMTPELAEHVVRCGAIEVAVSMSGSSAEEYENAYIGGDFGQVLRAIRCLADAKEKYKKKYPRILVNSLSYLHHLETFDSFVELVANQGANVVRMSALIEFDKIPALKNHSHTFGSPHLRSVYERATRIAQDRGVKLWIPDTLLQPSLRDLPTTSITEIQRLASRMNFEGVAYRPAALGDFVPFEATPQKAELQLENRFVDNPNLLCPEPFRMMYWAQSGRVYPCCHWKPTATALGDTSDASLNKVFQGPAYKALREGVGKNAYPRSGCGDCMAMKMTPASHDIGAPIFDYLNWHLERFGRTPLQDLGPPARSMGTLRDALKRRAFRSFVQKEFMVPADQLRDPPWELIHAQALRFQGNEVFGAPLFEGYIDHVSSSLVRGWAWSPHYPQVSLPLRIHVENRVISPGTSQLLRGDLISAKKGHGRFGFEAPLNLEPSISLDAIKVEIGETGIFLARSFPSTKVECLTRLRSD